MTLRDQVESGTEIPFIRRERDAVLINRISNDPAVRPFISRHGRDMDWSEAVESCVILSNGEDAVMVLEPTAERDFQMHTMFAATCRGKRAIATGLAMKEWIRPHADRIFGSIPNALFHARWFSRQLGGSPVEKVVSGGFEYTAPSRETLYEANFAGGVS